MWYYVSMSFYMLCKLPKESKEGKLYFLSDFGDRIIHVDGTWVKVSDIKCTQALTEVKSTLYIFYYFGLDATCNKVSSYSC